MLARGESASGFEGGNAEMKRQFLCRRLKNIPYQNHHLGSTSHARIIAKLLSRNRIRHNICKLITASGMSFACLRGIYALCSQRAMLGTRPIISSISRP